MPAGFMLLSGMKSAFQTHCARIDNVDASWLIKTFSKLEKSAGFVVFGSRTLVCAGVCPTGRYSASLIVESMLTDVLQRCWCGKMHGSFT
jgi:hypothetical protein